MKRRSHAALLARLAADYERRSPRSAAIHREALKHLVDGGSHTIRLLQPFPPRIIAAEVAYVTDEDGHRILDFWQGHYANILGHNPPVVAEVLARAFSSRQGLQTGFTDSLQVRTAELLCSRTGAERVRFTSSGSLATMYATFLSRGFTGRETVMKVGGGWHGAQPWGLVGVDFHAESAHSFEQQESKGLPHAVAEQVIVTRFNDASMLEEQFARHGSRIACFIFEPFLGAGGFLPATKEFLHAARELTTKHGALLVFDEVISGFRFCAGSIARLFGVQPDLATYAKVMGGGMPVAAVAGRADVMKLAGRGGGVKFSGGTYSCHPASMLASFTMMEHLVAQEASVYPRITDLAEKARQAVEQAFAAEGITAKCSGRHSDAIPASSMAAVHFPHDLSTPCDSPEQTRNPDVCDVELSESVLQLALLLEDVFVMHGLGAVSTAHTEEEIEKLGDACGRAAKRIIRFL
ncbi:MAG: aminotransferase class III-fold pyridoxal phosphate-dependent enzyme [Spirochaetia bacterium]